MMLFALSTLLVVVSGHKGFGPGDQEWGYVTIREGAHMFWWLHQTAGQEEKPLIIWLQGGPAVSSSGFGNFLLLGPLDLDLQPRNTTWTRNANILFIDSPVGTGFSYVDNSSLLTTHNHQIAKDLVPLMQGFFEKMPKFKPTPLYIAGESYGSKMGVEFAWELHKAIEAGKVDCNLRGIMMGNPWISPIDTVMNYAEMLLEFGEVDIRGRNLVQESALKTKQLTISQRYVEAYDMLWNTLVIISKVTHNIDIVNLLKEIKIDTQNLLQRNKPIESPKLVDLMNSEVKQALGLNVTFGAQSKACLNALIGDYMKTVTQIVEKVLTTNLKVFVYSGQLDLLCNTLGTVNWMDRLKWRGSKAWRNADRKAFAIDGIYEGYSKTVGNLGMFWVHRAGHMVPGENPEAMNFILNELTKD